MKKEGSTASMLWLDIRRGFCSKRFWGIVGVVTIVFVVFLTLDIIYPLQKYYNGYGTFDWKLDSISMAPFAVRIGILSMDLFITFFPFIGVIAYAGTIIDERKDGYCYQIIQKRGFHSYYWSHFVASGLDELCYQWAREYFRDADAKEDAESEEKFVPKTYNGKATKAGKKEKSKKAAPKPAPKPVDEEQLTFGDFGTEEAAG